MRAVFPSSSPAVCIITSGEATEENFQVQHELTVELAAAAAVAGVEIFQVREKSLPARLLSKLVDAVVAACEGSAVRVVVNDRADVASSSGAAGVHLTSQSIEASHVRRVFGDGFLIGSSAHSLEDVREARRSGCDYILFGPVFDTPSKRRFGAPQGIAALSRAVAAAESLPVFAVGGIDIENSQSVLDAGAGGVAAIRLFSKSEGLSEAVSAIKSLRTDRTDRSE